MENYCLSETSGLNWRKLLGAESIQDMDEVTSTGLSSKDLRNYFSKADFKKVLVVEDDATQYAILEELLAEINSEVEIDWEQNLTGAMNRIKKTSMATSKPYDLVISDVCLGNGEMGTEVYNYCNELEPKIECVLVSAHSLDKIIDEDQDKIEYIKKPIDFNIFYQKIAPLLTLSSEVLKFRPHRAGGIA